MTQGQHNTAILTAKIVAIIRESIEQLSTTAEIQQSTIDDLIATVEEHGRIIEQLLAEQENRPPNDADSERGRGC